MQYFIQIRFTTFYQKGFFDSSLKFATNKDLHAKNLYEVFNCRVFFSFLYASKFLPLKLNDGDVCSDFVCYRNIGSFC